MIYLDYQATTPLAPEARAAMLPWLDRFANPHSPHRPGREAKATVEHARDQVLAALLPGGSGPSSVEQGELFFTSGATEAINWAIKGSWARRAQGRQRVVTIATEHSCVLDTIRALPGAEVIVVPVGHGGRPDMKAVKAAITEATAIVAVMLVNNEIGTIGDVPTIGAHARAAGAVMLCDAVQGFGRIDIPMGDCDLVAVSAHKVYGPKGIGALWVRRERALAPLLHGGGQEGGLRSGTLSPMLCAGFGAAAAALASCKQSDLQHIERLWNAALTSLGPTWQVNGDRQHRFRGNLNLYREGVDAARLLSEVRDVAFSAGSACASGSGRPSHVLKAIGLSDAAARSSIRLGFGRYSTVEEIEQAAARINAAADRQMEWA